MQLFVLIQTSTIFISCGYPHWCQLEGPTAEVNGNNKILLDNRTVCFWTLYPYSSRPPVSTEGMLTFTLPGERIPSLKGRTRMHVHSFNAWMNCYRNLSMNRFILSKASFKVHQLDKFLRRLWVAHHRHYLEHLVEIPSITFLNIQFFFFWLVAFSFALFCFCKHAMTSQQQLKGFSESGPTWLVSVWQILSVLSPLSPSSILTPSSFAPVSFMFLFQSFSVRNVCGRTKTVDFWRVSTLSPTAELHSLPLLSLCMHTK